MSIEISLPTLNYNKSSRKEYKYADDLINEHNWSTDIRYWNQKINDYIDNRQRYAELQNDNKSLREVGIPEEEIRKTVDNFQTISFDILNDYFLKKIGDIIKKDYEHYEAGIRAPMNLYINEANIDKLPKEILNTILELDTIKNKLFNDKYSLSKILESEKINYNENYVKDGIYSSNKQPIGKYTIENKKLSSYGLYPEIIGTDISNLYNNLEEASSVSFVAGGLFDWKYVSPQERTIGSAGDFGAILMDILFKIIKVPTTITNLTKTTKDNADYIFNIIKNYYKPIFETNAIEDLLRLNTPIIDSNIKNPVFLGKYKYKFVKPDIYALWCINRCIRTPFYNLNSSDILETLVIKIENFFNYQIDENLNLLRLDTVNSLKLENLNLLKNKILNYIYDEKQNKSVLVPDIEIENGSNLLALGSIKALRNKLNKLNDNEWYQLLSHAFTTLYLNLLIAADSNWEKINENYQINISMNRLVFNKSNSINHTIDENTRDKIIKFADEEYKKYRDFLIDKLSNDIQNPIGGTLLINTPSITIEKYGNIINYPGDNNVYDGMSRYLKIFILDIDTFEKRLQNSLTNMSSMYWYRDVLKWLEVLFIIFKPFNASVTDYVPIPEMKIRFSKMKNVLEILYNKILNIISSYTDSLHNANKKYQLKKNINISLEKKIKNTSNITVSSICYIKRQIIIINYLLEKVIDSWWTTSPDMRHTRRFKPVFEHEEFKINYQNMKRSLDQDFFKKISTLKSNIADLNIKKEIDNIINNTCKIEEEYNKNSSRILENSNIKLFTKIDFWYILSCKLKNKNIKNIKNEIENLKRFYIPVYSDSQSYLFDIMPLVLYGEYKGNFGGKSQPQWLSVSDLIKKSFSENNPAIIMNSDSIHMDKMLEINIEWLDNVVEKSTDISESSGNSDKKIWYIRIAMYNFFTNDKLYNFNNINIKEINGDMLKILKEYLSQTNTNKQIKNKHIEFLSREYIIEKIKESIGDYYNI
jgi:hypothetical protein